MDGVFAVITGADMPKAPSKLVDLGEGNVNFKWASNKLMAQDKVIYKGHPVAAIAAIDRYVGEERLMARLMSRVTKRLNSVMS